MAHANPMILDDGRRTALVQPPLVPYLPSRITGHSPDSALWRDQPSVTR